LNNYLILALYCVYRRQHKLQDITKQQFVSSSRARFLLTCCSAYHLGRLQSGPHLVSAQHDRCSSDLYSIVTHPAIQTFSLTTMQLSSHGGFVGPSCLIHTSRHGISAFQRVCWLRRTAVILRQHVRVRNLSCNPLSAVQKRTVHHPDLRSSATAVVSAGDVERF